MANDKHIGRQRLFRNCAVVGVGLAGLLAVILAPGVVMPRILQRNPDWLRLGAIRHYSQIRRRGDGRRHSVLALLTHVGRRSARTYQTPLGAWPYGNGFILSLPYGSPTDWCRNVMAAGTCTLAWKGRTYELGRPEIISGPRGFQALPAGRRILLRAGGIHEFLWLHKRT